MLVRNLGRLILSYETFYCCSKHEMADDTTYLGHEVLVDEHFVPIVGRQGADVRQHPHTVGPAALLAKHRLGRQPCIRLPKGNIIS